LGSILSYPQQLVLPFGTPGPPPPQGPDPGDPLAAGRQLYPPPDSL